MNSSRLAAAAALFVSLSVPAMVACGGADDDVTARPARRSTRTKAASERLGQSGAWKLPANVKAAGLSQHVSYDSPPSWNGGANCSKKFTDGAKILKAHVSETYSGVASIGGYACRQNTANKAETSVHGTGRALDIMIPKSGSGADNGVGDPIANWLVTNAQSIGVQLIIWDGTKWNASSGGAKDKPYTGPNPHTDHIHVELSNEGASASTPWFADKKDATGGDSAANDTPSGDSSTGSKNTGSGSSTGGKNTGSGSSGGAGGAAGSDGEATDEENGGSAGSSGDETDEENGGAAGTSGDEETDPTNEENGGAAGSSDEETTEDGEQNQEENAVDDDAPASQACGDVTEQGSCDGNKVSFCDGGELIASDCANGNSCGSSDGYASCTDGEDSSNNEDSSNDEDSSNNEDSSSNNEDSSNNDEQTNEESSPETEDNTASNEEPSNEEPSDDSSGDDWQQDI